MNLIRFNILLLTLLSCKINNGTKVEGASESRIINYDSLFVVDSSNLYSPVEHIVDKTKIVVYAKPKIELFFPKNETVDLVDSIQQHGLGSGYEVMGALFERKMFKDFERANISEIELIKTVNLISLIQKLNFQIVIEDSLCPNCKLEVSSYFDGVTGGEMLKILFGAEDTLLISVQEEIIK